MGYIPSIIRFLPLNHYTAYISNPHLLPAEAHSLYGENEIYCLYTTVDGKTGVHHLVMMDENHLMLIDHPNPYPYLFQQKKLQYHHEHLTPVKVQFPIMTSMADYIHFSKTFRDIELDTAIYCIKPDIPFCLIHPDIVLPHFLNGLVDSEIAGMASQEQIDALYNIHLQRWKNVFTKKRVTHLLLSSSAMVNFVRTGRLSDQMFIIAPYTPAERRSILIHLRHQMIENPYFNIHIACDESLPFFMEITHFDGTGVLLSNAYTSYNLAEGHSEAIITQQDFVHTFREFYTQELLGQHVLPAKDCLRLLSR